MLLWNFFKLERKTTILHLQTFKGRGYAAVLRILWGSVLSTAKQFQGIDHIQLWARVPHWHVCCTVVECFPCEFSPPIDGSSISFCHYMPWLSEGQTSIASIISLVSASSYSQYVPLGPELQIVMAYLAVQILFAALLQGMAWSSEADASTNSWTGRKGSHVFTPCHSQPDFTRYRFVALQNIWSRKPLAEDTVRHPTWPMPM